MPDYWIKLYIEIIDDPKMATLPDRLWRRAIELFLLAGKLSHKTGQLPDVRQLAWCLRMSSEDLEQDLVELEKINIIAKNAEGWIVKNFVKRQDRLSDAERQKIKRERDRKQSYYCHENVTNESRNVTQITDNRLTESEVEGEISLLQAMPESTIPATTSSVIGYRVITELTGWTSPPSSIIQRVDDALNNLLLHHPTYEMLKQYLQPFYDEWINRGYQKQNAAWLWDWAVSGEIPPRSKDKTERANRLRPEGL